MDENAEFEREMTKAADRGATMATALKTIRDLIKDDRLLVEVTRHGDHLFPSPLQVTGANFDGPTRIVITTEE